MKTAILVIEIIISVALILSVITQSGSKSGLGFISGSSDSLASNKARGADVLLRKITVGLAVVFVILAIVLMYI